MRGRGSSPMGGTVDRSCRRPELFAGDVTDAELEEIEAYFLDLGADVNHELSPHVDNGLCRRLCDRGYRPVESANILYQPVDAGRILPHVSNPTIHCRLLGEGEERLWATISTEGWREFGNMDAMLSEVAAIAGVPQDMHLFVAELQGTPVAAAAVCVCQNVLNLAGASTIPGARRRGAQQALLDARLGFGVKTGCDLVVMGALPGSESQRNAERQVFRVAYTRTKWQLK